MGDGAGSSCTGEERALAKRVRAAVGGGSCECLVLSTCARLDVYAIGPGFDGAGLAAAVAADVGGAATARRDRPWGRGPPVDARGLLSVASGAAAAEHVLGVACFAGLPLGAFDPFDSHQAYVLSQVKAAFDDARAGSDPPIGPRLSALMRASLEAGKRARDRKSVSALGRLRGRTGADAAELMATRSDVAETVVAKVVAPAVEAYAASLEALDAAPALRRLTALADEAVAAELAGDATHDRAARLAAKRAIHGRLVAVRAGATFDDADSAATLAAVRAAVRDALPEPSPG